MVNDFTKAIDLKRQKIRQKKSFIPYSKFKIKKNKVYLKKTKPIKKKVKLSPKIKKNKIVTTYSWDAKPRKTIINKPRKTFIGDMGTGASLAVVGGGALAAGAVAGMAMGAADNEQLQRDITSKENELGIRIIKEKIDEDMNNILFTTFWKFKGLSEKGKHLLKNGEASLRMIEESLDHILGSMQAMDNNCLLYTSPSPRD